MTLQNRVTPFGDIVAVAARGTVMGNRGGPLHRPDRTLTRRRWVNRRWIACRLAFRGRHRAVMTPGRYTELFFLDEATAFAAGHRPCAECRRADFNRFKTAFCAAHFPGCAPESISIDRIDALLHRERLAPPRALDVAWETLPDGTMVADGNRAFLVWRRALWRWGWDGYAPAPAAPVTLQLLTPSAVVAAFAAGYTLTPHPSQSGADD